VSPADNLVSAVIAMRGDPSPRSAASANARARFVYLLDAHHRARRLTRAARDIGRALFKRLGQDGQCDPSHARLAEDVACCPRTVWACEALRQCGLLTWVRRLRRDGPYVAQTSNAYRLLASETAVAADRLGDGQNRHGSQKEVFLFAPAALTRAAKGVLKRAVAPLAEEPEAARARTVLTRLRLARERQLGLRA
jgi:hypothetical protein